MLVANSLPQSPAATAPSSEGAKPPGDEGFPLREPSPAGDSLPIKKAALSSLTKRLRGAILMSVRTAAIAVAVVPVVSFELEGNAAYRSGGRLFLMSEGRYDQRRKTDEHQRICKHICICDHIAHPLFDRGRFCGNAGRHRTPQKSRFCGGPLEFHRFPASELPKIGRRHSPAGAARDLPRAARAAQCRREPVFRRLRRFD